VTLFARIDKICSNQQYEDPGGFLRPGLGVSGGIRLTAGGSPSSGGLPNAIPSANTTPRHHRRAAKERCDD